jgi:hypothetical protein
MTRHRRVLSAVGIVAVALVGAAVAVRASREVLFDDAAITMRYAVRIAHGHGFTYNDRDRTDGASAPLYTLVLALLTRLGWDPEIAARVIGVIAFGTTCGLVTSIGARLSGLWGAVLGAVLTVLSAAFLAQSTTGMESAFAAALGVGALWFLSRDREVAAGILLGLAVMNKLDAGLLAIGILLSFATIRRTIPWRLIVAALLTALPWLLFSQWYFGSPIPYSALQKVTGHAANPLNRTWLLSAIVSDGALIPAVLALAASVVAMVWHPARRERGALVLVAATGWFTLHALAFSLIDLGDAYPWYTTVLFPAIATAAAASLSIVRRAIEGRSRIAVPAFAVVLVLIGGAKLPAAHRVAAEVWHGHRPNDYEMLDATRREAGRFLGRTAKPGEVIQTCFGWVAYGAPYNPVKETCPLSTRQAVARPTWVVEISDQGVLPETAPAGTQLIRGYRARHASTWVFRRVQDG